VTPVEPLKDGTYGRTWQRNYGTVQISSGWLSRRKLTVKAGVVNLRQRIKAVWIREIYHVCRSGKLLQAGRAYWTDRAPIRKTMRVDRWSFKELMGMTFEGLWLTSRVTIEMPDGSRSSLRTTIPILPPEGVANPNR